jgi:hypothetical protein
VRTDLLQLPQQGNTPGAGPFSHHLHPGSDHPTRYRQEHEGEARRGDRSRTHDTVPAKTNHPMVTGTDNP